MHFSNKDVGHFLCCLLGTFISSFEDTLFRSLAYLFGSFILSFLCLLSYLHILNFDSLLMYNWWIISYPHWVSSSLPWSFEHADCQSILTDSLWRPYSELECLRNSLSFYCVHTAVPPLPEKQVGSKAALAPLEPLLTGCSVHQGRLGWHSFFAHCGDPDCVEKRISLENFVLMVESHPILCRDKILYLFWTQVLFF